MSSSARSLMPRAHAVVHASRAEPALRDGEARPGRAQQAVRRHPGPLEAQLAVPLVVVIAEHGQVADEDHSGSIERDKHDRVPPVDLGVRVTHAEYQGDAAPRP